MNPELGSYYFAVGLTPPRSGYLKCIDSADFISIFKDASGRQWRLEGHPWDGSLESLKSTDGVGLDVYLALLKAQGGKVVQS